MPALFLIAGLVFLSWQFGFRAGWPTIPTGSTDHTKDKVQTQEHSGSPVTSLASSYIFPNLPADFQMRQSLLIGQGLTPFPLDQLAGLPPAFALVGSAEARDIAPARMTAHLITHGQDGLTVSPDKVFLPPASRLKAILRASEDHLIILSEQAGAYLLQEIHPDGRTIWSRPLPIAQTMSDRVAISRIGNGTIVVYPDKEAGGLMASFIDNAGQQDWSRRIAPADAGAPFIMVSPFHEMVLFHVDDRWLSLVALSPDGQELWTHRYPLTNQAYIETVAIDALGSVHVLTGPLPGMHLISFNSVGSLDRDVSLPPAPASGLRACHLESDAAQTDIVCAAPSGLARLTLLRDGQSADWTILPSEAVIEDVLPYPEGGFLAILARAAKTENVYLDIISPAPQPVSAPPGPQEQISPGVAGPTTPRTSTGAGALSEPIKAEADISAAPDPVSEPVHLPDPAAVTGEELPLQRQCQVQCAAPDTPAARFPMRTVITGNTLASEAEWQALIRTEWARICESEGGVMAEATSPSCHP